MRINENEKESENKLNTQKKYDFLLALKNGFLISDACRECGISRRTYNYWMNNDPDFAEEARFLEEEILDVVERSLYKKIVVENNLNAMLFYLRTKGRERGWIEDKDKGTWFQNSEIKITYIVPEKNDDDKYLEQDYEG